MRNKRAPATKKRLDAWLVQARAWARAVCRRKGTVTVNDIRAHIAPPRGIDPRVMGNVLVGKEFRRVGYATSKRKESHGRPIAVFVLVKEKSCHPKS